MKYSLRKGILKVVKYFVIFLLPQLVNDMVVAYPEFFQLTVGALLVGIVNFITIRVKIWMKNRVEQKVDIE
jgi:hypothetical protein